MVMTMMICVSLGPKGKWGLECGSAPAGRLPCSSYKNYPALLVSYIQQKNYPALLMRSHKKYYRWQKIHQGWPPIAWVCTFLYFLIPRYLKSQISKSTEEYQFDNCCGSLVRDSKGRIGRFNCKRKWKLLCVGPTRHTAAATGGPITNIFFGASRYSFSRFTFIEWTVVDRTNWQKQVSW